MPAATHNAAGQGAGPVIQLEDVYKTFELGGQSTEVLKGIDLAVNQGEFVALQGPSGSGKSTLLHILGLLDRTSAGRYLLSGEDVADMDDDARSHLRNMHFGFVFQNFHLIPYATALENVVLPGMYGPESRREVTRRAERLLDQVGLADRSGYRPGQLSGGQQQRVAMARALVNQPKVVFADEPTGQLDSTTSKEIMDLFAAINDTGTTMVMVTHDADTAGFAGRVVNLLDGRIAHD